MPHRSPRPAAHHWLHPPRSLAATLVLAHSASSWTLPPDDADHEEHISNPTRSATLALSLMEVLEDCR